MLKRLSAIVLAMVLCFSCLSSVCTAAAQYRQEDAELELRELMEEYCGSYWYSSFQGSSQCKGFADLVFDALFGTGGPGPYSDSRYTLPDATSRSCTCIGILSSSESNYDSLKALLSQALPGDYVQCVRYTGTQHSMIVLETSDTGITFFDCNLKGSYLCASYTYTWDEASDYLTRGISLYRHNGYVPSESYRLYFDPESGKCTVTSAPVKKGAAYGILPLPERKGYLFDGWYYLCYGSSKTPTKVFVNENTVHTVNGNVYLHAAWQEDPGPCATNGHSWKTKVTPPTCVTDGNTTETCTVCGISKISDIQPATGHSWTNTSTLAPTCKDDGYTLQTCTTCNATQKVNMVPASHTYREVSCIPATNGEDGYITYLCTSCGYTVTETLPSQLHRFTDLQESAWYYPYVKEMVVLGIMNGTSDAAFSPNNTLTRGMLVTILYRMQGEPEAAIADYTDVPTGKWYAAAVGWASENGIVTGYPDKTFRPNAPVTREQAATILYRCAPLMGRSTALTASLEEFTDMDTISAYAQTPMAWAKANDILSGYPDETLRPGGSASRAQIAKMIVTFTNCLER